MFLVESNGELILCLRVHDQHQSLRECGVSVYRVDFVAKNIVPLHVIDGRVLFLAGRDVFAPGGYWSVPLHQRLHCLPVPIIQRL